MPANPIGRTHRELSDWLVRHWLKEGPVVCFVEGFSGVGKTTVARQIIPSSGWKGVIVTMPEPSVDQADNLFLALATELSEGAVGIDSLADAVTEGKPFAVALPAALAHKVLIVVDEFQRALDERGRPSGPILHLLERLASKPGLQGRLLCLTNRSIERSKWSEPFEQRSLAGLPADEAEQLLEAQLTATGRSSEIAKERRRDVVNWLGGNPRAINVLVASLGRSSLDELIGLSPEAWEARDREISAELLHRLERELLERTMEDLGPETATVLARLSVYRKSVKRDAVDRLLPAGADFASVRDALLDRFLMEHHLGWFALHPVVREIALQKLKDQPDRAELKRAHSAAAQHYMRHFQAKEIVGGGRLGGYFVEARYHLVQSSREAELREIAGQFEKHLRSSFSPSNRVPARLDELNEQIATLAALLETPGSKGLEYYLARLYDARRAEGDSYRALQYARRASGPRAPAETWVLRLRLEALFVGPDELLRIAREGIAAVPAEKNLFALYRSAAELLARAGRRDEAIAILKEGIGVIPAEKSAFSLYQSAGELLAQAGRLDEAIAILKEGIAAISEKHLFPLYESAGKLLAQEGRLDEAIAILKEGIATIPVDKNRYKLVEPVLIFLVAQRNLQLLDEFLAGTGAMAIGPPQLLFGGMLRLIIQGDWRRAATMASQERVKLQRYRPVIQMEGFAWLSAGEPRLAEETLQLLGAPDKLHDSLYWLRAWVALKLQDRAAARENLSTYLNRPVSDDEVGEELLLRLWDAPPTEPGRTDLAYFYPILPATLTGLPCDVVRLVSESGVVFRAQQEPPAPRAPAIMPPAPAATRAAAWPAWMDEAVSGSGGRPRVDVAILVALEEEFQELIAQVQPRLHYEPELRQYYYLFEYQRPDRAAPPSRCVATFMGAMGPSNAVADASHMIRQFNPATIVSIGLAGSMDRDVLVGDVVVADQTDEYLATSKAVEGRDRSGWEFRLSGNVFRGDPAYIAHARNFRFIEANEGVGWQSQSRQRLEALVGPAPANDLVGQRLIREVPEVHVGHIASGPVVGAASLFVEWLREGRDRKFLALEMESAGVLNAAHRQAVSSLIIRGISDYSDERKSILDEVGRGALRRYAMRNALALLWAMLGIEAAAGPRGRR